MDAEIESQARELCRIIHRLMSFMQREPEWMESCGRLAGELSMAQLKCLLSLRSLAPCSLKDLAAELNVAPASASGMVERLVEMGLVDRRQDPQDRRQVQISLAPPAQAIVESHEAFFVRKLAWLIRELDSGDARKWLEIYRKLDQILTTAPATERRADSP